MPLEFKKRKELLGVLSSMFSTLDDFRTFLRDNVGQPLDDIAVGSLKNVRSRVVDKAYEEEWLQQLIDALREVAGPNAKAKLDSIGTIEGIQSENVPNANAERLAPATVVNFILTVLAVVLGWLWFHFHIKRYVTGWVFGGVSVIAAAAFAWSIWKTFAGDELKTLPRRWLDGKYTRVTLIVLLVFVIAAHLLTGSLHIDADPQRIRDGEKIIANFARGSDTVKTVTLDAKHNEAALTFLVWAKPVTIDVVTKEPRGFEQEQVEVGRFVHTLTLPNSAREKSYNLVRLASGLFLFSLRNKPPDPAYDVEIWVNGKMVKSIDALGFQTFYIGGAAGDLKAIRDLHDSPRHHDELDRFLRNLGVPEMKRKEMIKDWLSDPVYLDTPELKSTDKVRVVVKRGAVVSFDQKDITPKQRAQLETTFLKGVPQQ